MALSFKASFVCSSTPFARNRTSQIARSNLVKPKPNVNTQNWSIPQNDLSLVSSPLRHPRYVTEHLHSRNVNEDFDIEHAQKLNSFKHILMNQGADSFESLAMIDAIQRLGIDYLFQEEIGTVLARHYLISSNNNHGDNDLHEVALRFRLLRQQGYHVPSGVFDKFKDKEGKFKKETSGDIKGLMSLYEASQLSIRGEVEVDEAGNYSYVQLLNSIVTRLDYSIAGLACNTLSHPHHKSLTISMDNKFVDGLNVSNGWINVLKDFAKAEFKKVQSQHQHEMIEISKWWKDLGLCKELKFARDQPLKWYMWSTSCLPDPRLSEKRIELTKPISMIYIIDDIFDVYGTPNELILFTEIVRRWDIAAIEQLPDYMKTCFNALNNITNEISYKVYKEHGWNPVDSLRKTWASLCSAFLVEAKWFASGKLPNADQYLENGIVSSGVNVMLVHTFFLLGEGINKENVELVDSNPGIISSTATILRLWDDLGSAEDENQDGHDGSYVECYMKENEGSSVEDARNRALYMISEAWKQLNEECLSPNPFSPTFSKASLNIARMVPLMYSYDDNHRLPNLEEHVKSLLCENASP